VPGAARPKSSACGGAGLTILRLTTKSAVFPGRRYDARVMPARETADEVLIVGGGFAGVCMGIKLKEAGLDAFTILERADEVGGTWRDNRYPGCACDVPANLYSFSFDPNPGWARTYAERDDIWAYLRRCVERHGLGPHIRRGEEMVRAEYDEARALTSRMAPLTSCTFERKSAG